ncbi:DUF4860 domain-containing protein [Aminipila sp.]|uniref:DUF4860 domain-containing protein n=1 Tax=Aminipila sp. TaxID=2060095 RepID=UPI001D57772E|nr:DUF4860 domain-containing protein [Aminipila sp.]MBE6033104.1 DUF4860 domain-containing protein [Clostridiales bacterium]
MRSKGIYNKGQSVQFLFTMILLFALAISALFTILFGARIYENVGTRMDENFGTTTALSYISNKVKQNDKSDMISVQNIENTSVLKLSEVYDGQVYSTLIYCKDGNLKELFSSEDSGLTLEDGINIMELQGMSFKMIKDNLLKVKITDENSNYLLLSLRSEVKDDE